jgi:hypothetical protein
MTFEEFLEAYPPPPGVDGAAALAFWDRNDDRTICPLVLSEPRPDRA